MDGWEDFHRRRPRIDALELLVNLQDAPQLAVELVPGNVREVEIDALTVLLDAQPFVHADVENLASGNVARHKVAIFWIALLQEVIPLALGNAQRVAGILWRP